MPYWFLFSDVLVWTKPKKESAGEKVFDFVSSIPLSEVSIGETPKKPKYEIAFTLVVEDEVTTGSTCTNIFSGGYSSLIQRKNNKRGLLTYRNCSRNKPLFDYTIYARIPFK